MAAGINYFRLLWNLYRQKRNASRTKEQIEKLQKKKLENCFFLSIKNPRSGHIIADSVGEIIHGDAVMECTGEVILRAEGEKKVERISEASKDIA